MILNHRGGSSVIPLLLVPLCYSTCDVGGAHYFSSTPLAQSSVTGGLPALERVCSCFQPVATKGTVILGLCKW